MVTAADREGFGGCTLHGECQAACPKHIDLAVIARMNRDYLAASLTRWWGGHSRDVVLEPVSLRDVPQPITED
jgi:hypothetical protein